MTRLTIHKGRRFSFEAVSFAQPDGRILQREVVRHPGAVVIVPILDDSADPELVLVENLRVAMEKTVLEFPAGTIEQGELPCDCAARELIEETGYKAKNLHDIGRFYTSPGMSDELMHAFVGTKLTEEAQNLDEDECLTVKVIKASTLLGLIDNGELIDGKSMLAFLLALRQGFVNPGRAGEAC